MGLDAEMTYIAMTEALQNNERDQPDIFLRKCQKELWAEVIDFLESIKHSNAIITGNPGIGKSRSMAYCLKLLLKKKKTVVYEARKDNTAFAFIPQENGSYKV